MIYGNEIAAGIKLKFSENGVRALKNTISKGLKQQY